MLWLLFVLAFIMPNNLGDAACTGGCCGGKRNLTKVTWEHAVNDVAKLETTLKNDAIQMIEADIVMGTVKTKQTVDAEPAAPGLEIPIMGHPPAKESDLSFADFVATVSKYNDEQKDTKGVKLDFKTIEAVQKSMEILRNRPFTSTGKVWINADIVAGPGALPATKPVDPKQFFDAVKSVSSLSKSTYSIGWTTGVTEGKIESYTDAHINEMLKVIADNDISTLHEITFPVRAVIAVESKETLEKLLKEAGKNHKSTLTIWSAANDEVDAAKLRDTIQHFGVDKVYLDVPEKVHKELNLPSSASSLMNFGLLNVAAFLFAFFIRNGIY